MRNYLTCNCYTASVITVSTSSNDVITVIVTVVIVTIQQSVLWTPVSLLDGLTTNFPLPSCSKLYVNQPSYTSPCKCYCVFTVSSSFVQTSNHCSGKRAPDTGESVTSGLLTATLLHEIQTMQAVHEPTNQTPFYGVTDRANLLTNE